MLVSDGAKLGAVAIELEDGLVSFALPKGTAEGQDIIPNSVALPFVLAPERFAQADANERRNVLFTLTGAKIKPEDIANRLLARGCDAGLVTQIKPILRTGFGPGAEFAKQQATQAKGAWRAATGETYGEKKAEDWAADVPTLEHAELERASAELAALDARVEATAQSLGQITQRAAAYAAARDHIAARQARAARLPELQRKLEFDLAEHARAAAHVESLEARAGTGPRVGLVHDLARCLTTPTTSRTSASSCPPSWTDGSSRPSWHMRLNTAAWMPPAATRKHPPPCRRRSKPATSWPAASRTTAATLPPQKKPPKNRPATPRPR